MVLDKATWFTRLAPYLLLAILGAIFFGPLVLHPTFILYSDASDFIVEHVPAKHFLIESWRETGQLPQWCPYNLGGMPFLHDTQTAAFYPPHAILYIVPSRLIGPVLSWLTVAHVILAGWGMHAYSHRRGLGAAGSLVAAMGFMFAGKWLMHVLAAGQIVVLGLAWVPFVLMYLEEAIRRGSFDYATLAAVFFALIALSGHPQVTLYSGLFVALWTMEAGRAAGWKRWLLYGGWTCGVGFGLAAIELLPAAAATPLSTRSLGTADHGVWVDTRNILLIFGPFLGHMLHEHQGGIGLLEFALAGLALFLAPRKARWPAFVFVILCIFAFGGGDLVRRLPFLWMFRLPTRMMQWAAFPAALMAGLAVDALLAGPLWSRALRSLSLFWLGGTGAIGAALVLLGGHFTRSLDHVVPYAVSLTITFGIAAALLLLSRGQASPWRATLIVAIVGVDLWMLSWGLVVVRREDEIYAVSPCVQYLADRRDERVRVLDRDSAPGISMSPLGTGTPLALLLRLEPVRGYEPLDVRRYKEFLALIENRAPSLRAGGNFTYPALNDFKLSNHHLLDLLGVRYILQPADSEPASPAWEEVMQDEEAVGYEMSSRDEAGVHSLLPYVLYRNPNALPRAFVVHEALPLRDGPLLLPMMKMMDFRRRVLLEDFTTGTKEPTAEMQGPRTAMITVYEPDRVVIEVSDGPPGWLVLTDVWYPGWSCTVNGRPTVVHRANFLFRSVPVAAGPQEVVFNFSLPRYELGKLLSTLGLAAVVVYGFCCLILSFLRSYVPARRY
jgi:hypothetical protein